MRGSDTGDAGKGRGCGRVVDVGSVGCGGTGMTQLKGLRTAKTPGVLAPAAFAAFVTVGCVCCCASMWKYRDRGFSAFVEDSRE